MGKEDLQGVNTVLSEIHLGLGIQIVQIPRPPLVICHLNKFYVN